MEQDLILGFQLPNSHHPMRLEGRIVWLGQKGIGVKFNKLTPNEDQGIRLALENRIPFGVTPHYLHLMDYGPSEIDFAVRRQVFPPPAYIKTMMEHRREKRIVFDNQGQAELQINGDFNREVCNTMQNFFKKLQSAYYSTPLPE